LGFRFCLKSDSSVDAMIKMPPAAQKVMVVPHKVNGILEDMLSSWIIQHFMEFIHHNQFNWWELDLQDRV
jgi:hypothetical protein